jgi:hypothetical protein
MGNNYLKLIYNYYKNDRPLSIVLHIYNNYMVIPFGSYIYYNNMDNHEMIQSLLEKEIIEQEKYHEVIDNDTITRYKYKFNRDYSFINTPNLQDQLMNFYRLVGYGCDKTNYLLFNINSYTVISTSNRIRYAILLEEQLLKKRLPIIYKHLFGSFIFSIFGCILVDLLFKDEDLIEELITLDNINQIAKFFMDWKGVENLNKLKIMDEFFKLSKKKAKINFLFENGFIIHDHKFKLLKLKKRKNFGLIEYIFDLIKKNFTIFDVKNIYELIDAEDDNIITIYKEKKCMIQ